MHPRRTAASITMPARPAASACADMISPISAQVWSAFPSTMITSPGLARWRHNNRLDRFTLRTQLKENTQ